MTRLALLVALSGMASAAAQPKPPAELEKPLELFRAGKFDDCLEELRKATKANANLLPPRVILADWFVKANQGANARLNIERAAAEDPRHPDVYLLNASFAFGEGRITDALLNLQLAQQLAADVRWTAEQRKRFLLESRLGQASCLENRGDVAAARESLLAVLTDDPKNGAVRQRMAAATFALGKPDEAFTELVKARADDPAVELPELRMAALWSAKAATTPKAEEAKAHRDQAEGWLKKAVAAHPKSIRPFTTYANWLLEDGRPDAAAPYVDAAAKLEPTARDTLGVQGLLARHRKDFAAAEATFERLYKDGPSDPFALANLALVLAESADVEKQKRAINLAGALMQQNQRSVDAAAVLGWSKLKAGRLDEAEQDFAAVLKAGGQLSLDSVYFLAKMLTERKKVEDAHKFLTAAVDARGPFVYRADAKALLAELAKQLPPPKK